MAICEGCHGGGDNWNCEGENDPEHCDCEGCTGVTHCQECGGEGEYEAQAVYDADDNKVWGDGISVESTT